MKEQQHYDVIAVDDDSYKIEINNYFCCIDELNNMNMDEIDCNYLDKCNKDDSNNNGLYEIYDNEIWVDLIEPNSCHSKKNKRKILEQQSHHQQQQQQMIDAMNSFANYVLLDEKYKCYTIIQKHLNYSNQSNNNNNNNVGILQGGGGGYANSSDDTCGTSNNDCTINNEIYRVSITTFDKYNDNNNDDDNDVLYDNDIACCWQYDDESTVTRMDADQELRYNFFHSIYGKKYRKVLTPTKMKHYIINTCNNNHNNDSTNPTNDYNNRQHQRCEQQQQQQQQQQQRPKIEKLINVMYVLSYGNTIGQIRHIDYMYPNVQLCCYMSNNCRCTQIYYPNSCYDSTTVTATATTSNSTTNDDNKNNDDPVPKYGDLSDDHMEDTMSKCNNNTTNGTNSTLIRTVSDLLYYWNNVQQWNVPNLLQKVLLEKGDCTLPTLQYLNPTLLTKRKTSKNTTRKKKISDPTKVDETTMKKTKVKKIKKNKNSRKDGDMGDTKYIFDNGNWYSINQQLNMFGKLYQTTTIQTTMNVQEKHRNEQEQEQQSTILSSTINRTTTTTTTTTTTKPGTLLYVSGDVVHCAPSTNPNEGRMFLFAIGIPHPKQRIRNDGTDKIEIHEDLSIISTTPTTRATANKKSTTMKKYNKKKMTRSMDATTNNNNNNNQMNHQDNIPKSNDHLLDDTKRDGEIQYSTVLLHYEFCCIIFQIIRQEYNLNEKTSDNVTNTDCTTNSTASDVNTNVDADDNNNDSNSNDNYCNNTIKQQYYECQYFLLYNIMIPFIIEYPYSEQYERILVGDDKVSIRLWIQKVIQVHLEEKEEIQQQERRRKQLRQQQQQIQNQNQTNNRKQLSPIMESEKKNIKLWDLLIMEAIRNGDKMFAI